MDIKQCILRDRTIRQCYKASRKEAEGQDSRGDAGRAGRLVHGAEAPAAIVVERKYLRRIGRKELIRTEYSPQLARDFLCVQRRRYIAIGRQ